MGRDAGKPLFRIVLAISIHAPRVGRDLRRFRHHQRGRHISIHAPRVGRDPEKHDIIYSEAIFQSTRPVWGATLYGRNIFADTAISIHAPRVGRDCQMCSRHLPLADFNPRAPCGARQHDKTQIANVADFNPRAPCGARLCDNSMEALTAQFQSTRPVWGATVLRAAITLFIPFQSTRPVWGATWRSFSPRCWTRFQSTRPVWGATSRGIYIHRVWLISIHAPRVGRDHSNAAQKDVIYAFQSTRPVWGATVWFQSHKSRGKYFNPRAPCGARQQI